GVARARSNSANRRHCTGNDDHRIKSRRAADERNIEIVLRVLHNRFWNLKSAQLLLHNLFGMATQDEMNLVSSGIDLIEQSLQIDGTAGTGGSEDKFNRRRV